METTAELILKGHFSQLKDQINKEVIQKEYPIEERVEEMLNQMFHYLRKQQAANRLDVEGLELYQHLEQVLVEIRSNSKISVPDKLPMQKAKGRQSSKEQRKTGS